uniref:Integrin beta-1-like n=1 Tax=Maylandia zebra TaxID=106582 RepID=A0A3P9DIW0_9CICH
MLFLVILNFCRTDIADAKTIFLQPQELAIHLRPGVSQSFPLSISMPSDHPTTDLTLDTSNVPAGLNITFSSITTGNPLLMQVRKRNPVQHSLLQKENVPSCLSPKNQIIRTTVPLALQVTVEAAQCPSKSDISNQNSTGPWSVQITPRGFAKSCDNNIKNLFASPGQCSCTENREENSPTCSSHGALVCGRCVCYQPYVGNLCQTDITSFESENEDSCRSRPGAPVCSGRGVCVSGMCHCNQRENPEKIRGQFCECTNFDCPYHENRICGGNGICECGMCRCYANWTGSDCSCSTETASCVAKNQQLCNGRGNCVCGKCQCLPQYQGPTCEDCPVCVDTEEYFRDMLKKKKEEKIPMLCHNARDKRIISLSANNM